MLAVLIAAVAGSVSANDLAAALGVIIGATVASLAGVSIDNRVRKPNTNGSEEYEDAEEAPLDRSTLRDIIVFGSNPYGTGILLITGSILLGELLGNYGILTWKKGPRQVSGQDQDVCQFSSPGFNADGGSSASRVSG